MYVSKEFFIYSADAHIYGKAHFAEHHDEKKIQLRTDSQVVAWVLFFGFSFDNGYYFFYAVSFFAGKVTLDLLSSRIFIKSSKPLRLRRAKAFS